MSSSSTKKPSEKDEAELPAMLFNEALKREWAALPMPHVKKKTAAKAATNKPAK